MFNVQFYQHNVSATGLWKAAIVAASMHKIAELICACLQKPTARHFGADSGNHQANSTAASSIKHETMRENCLTLTQVMKVIDFSVSFLHHHQMSKCAKNTQLHFPEPNVTSSNCFFCPNNGPKHKESSFVMINDTEKQQIVTFQKLNQQFFTFLLTKWND